MTKMMELDRALRGAMAPAMPGACTRPVVNSLILIRETYSEQYRQYTSARQRTGDINDIKTNHQGHPHG